MPPGSAIHAFFEIVTQLKWGLTGLAGSVLITGGVISATITSTRVAG